jgi:hypothetical protein
MPLLNNIKRDWKYYAMSDRADRMLKSVAQRQSCCPIIPRNEIHIAPHPPTIHVIYILILNKQTLTHTA